MIRPQDCTSMADIRAGIDQLDKDLVALLARRAGFIHRAAQIKADIGLPARIDARVEQVVTNVRAHARAEGLPEDMIEGVWRNLIDWSIAREEDRLGRS